MNIPCSTDPVTCPAGQNGDDALISNAGIETPDVRMFFARRFALRSSSYCEATTQLAADLCALSPPDPFDDDVIYSSNAQTCTIDCSGSPLAYTIAAGAALGFTQAAADAAAYSLACTYAGIICSGGTPTLVPNEAQACSVTCSDGSVQTATVPAGALLGLSLAEANASAYAIACQAAALQCPNVPPPLFGNVATSANSDCPSGGTFTYHVAANTFFASTQGEANAAAQSYAEQQAVLDRSCLSDITTATCGDGGGFYNDVITTTLPGTITWLITSGSLPPNLSFSDGSITGTPNGNGVFTFTVRATSSNGNYAVREYSITLIEITTVSITAAEVGIPYSFTFTAAGSSAYTWSSSSLPAWMTLNKNTGEISGTPTAVGSDPNFFISYGPCSKQFTFTVNSLQPLDWWQMDEAGNGNRIGSVNAISLGCSSGASSVAGGKYGNATALNSQGTPANIDCSCNNTSVPVVGLAYDGLGIDAFIWIDNPAGLINSDTVFLLNFADSGGTTVWSMRFTIDNQVGIEYDMTGGASGNIPLATSAAYRFFELYYDPALTRLGLRINNGAVMDQWITVAAPATTAKGSISITYDRRTGGTSAANVCEMAVYPAILNSTQRAYLFNAGAGQTWPNSLP